jgi:hypothetical protein
MTKKQIIDVLNNYPATHAWLENGRTVVEFANGIRVKI